MDQVVLMLDADLMDYLQIKKLSLEEFGLLTMLGRGNYDLLDIYCKKGLTMEQKKSIFQSLMRKQLLTYGDNSSFRLEDYELTEAGKSVIVETSSRASTLELTSIPQLEVKTEMDVFIQKYLELFPKGVKNGGSKPLRSNSTDVKAKMLKFMNKYKHPKEVILKATENYLERLRGVYTYCPTSEYFIMKDGSSALATECDMVKNGSNENEIINPFEKRM